jgi:ferritin-like metal-binding protein YciE
MEQLPRIPTKELNPAELRHFFISHLNRICCAKSQLVDKLPQLRNRSHFLDLRQAIDETIQEIQIQITRIKAIYIELDNFYQPESCIGLIGVLDEAFQSIGLPNESPALRDLSVLFYMENIEMIEASSFETMMRVANKLELPNVLQLLQECYDEAKEDTVLYRQITENYVS